MFEEVYHKNTIDKTKGHTFELIKTLVKIRQIILVMSNSITRNKMDYLNDVLKVIIFKKDHSSVMLSITAYLCEFFDFE